MATVNPIPEVLTAFNIYDETDRLIGVTGDVTLPNLEPVAETITGAGILGEYDAPVPGYFGSLTMEIGFGTITDVASKLLIENDHNYRINC